MRLARFVHVRFLRHALPISSLILRKKPTVLQSSGVDGFSVTCLCQKFKNTVIGSINPFMSSMSQLWTH